MRARQNGVGFDRGLVAGVFVAALLAATFADAACTAPSPPDQASRPEKPAAPTRGPCVDAKPGAAGCLGWEAYSYNDEVKAYNEKAKAFQKSAQTYVERLNAYVSAAADYARCEIKPLQ